MCGLRKILVSSQGSVDGTKFQILKRGKKFPTQPRVGQLTRTEPSEGKNNENQTHEVVIERSKENEQEEEHIPQSKNPAEDPILHMQTGTIGNSSTPKEDIATENRFQLLQVTEEEENREIPEKDDQNQTTNLEDMEVLSDGACTGGGIIRNHTGHLVKAFSSYYGGFSSLYAETRAVLEGITMCLEMLVILFL